MKYLLITDSYENDMDNEWSKENVYETEEEANLVLKLCNELFTSEEDNENAIGNSAYQEGAENLIIEYIEKNQDILKINNVKSDDENGILKLIFNYNYDTLGRGTSDGYVSRVFEDGKVKMILRH